VAAGARLRCAPSLARGIGLQQEGFRFGSAVCMWIVCTPKGMTRGGGSSLGAPAAGGPRRLGLYWSLPKAALALD